MNRYYKTAGEMGITVAYEASAEEFIAEGDSVTAVVVDVGGRREQVRAKAIVVCRGRLRGQHRLARALLGRGGDELHHPRTGLQRRHDAAGPLRPRCGECGGGEGLPRRPRSTPARRASTAGSPRASTRIPFGVVVNRFAERFYDEGEELWPKRYAIWGRNIAEQDGQIAYAIWDSKVTGLFLPPMYGPIRADSLAELAATARPRPRRRSPPPLGDVQRRGRAGGLRPDAPR